VAAGVWIRAGSAHERPDEFGAAHLLEHLLFRGTTKRGPGEMDREIETYGGLLNAGTTRDAAHLYTALPVEHVSAALEPMADAVFAPTLTNTHVELERSVILDELARWADDADKAVSEAALRVAWADGPYARPVLSDAVHIGTIKGEAVRAFHRRLYRPGRVIVVLAGEIEAAGGHEAIERAFGSYPASSTNLAPDVSRAVAPTPVLGPVRLAATPGRPACEVWAWRVARPDTASALLVEVAAAVLARTLAGSASGPEIAGLDAGAVALADGAVLFVRADVAPPAKALSAARLQAAVERLATDGPTEADMASARRRILGERLFRLETCLGLARELGRWEVLGDASAALNAERALAALTPTQVRDFIARWLTTRPVGPEGAKP